MSVRSLKKIRLYYKGDIIVTSLHRIALENDTNFRGAVALMEGWIEAGDLRRRPDGGFDVIHFRPPKGKPVKPSSPNRNEAGELLA